MNEIVLPSGIVSFLFTDIKGSTPLWEQDPDGMREALEIHNAILHEAIQAHKGHVFKIVGDEFQAAFSDTSQAIRAAMSAQRNLHRASWGRVGPLQVRMGIHAGYALTEGNDYTVSHTLNRVARIMSAADGGQILLSADAIDQMTGSLPDRTTLRDMGRQLMKGMRLREHLFQLIAPDLPGALSPLKAAGEIPPNVQSSDTVYKPSQLMWDEEETLPLFVGREKELARLFDPSAGQVQFVIGGAGRGKTALITAYAHQAMEVSPDLLVLRGYCRDLVGLGEPLLPFRQIFSQLTGDISNVAVISNEQAQRLWEAMPQAMPILLSHGQNLVGSLLPGQELRLRVVAHEQCQADWLRRLDNQLDNPDRSTLRRDWLHGQVSTTLKAIAKKRPLLIIFEDLHWIDAASADLLFHLSDEVIGSPITVLCSYRPEEVSSAEALGKHPLANIIKEYKRRFGDIWLDLGGENDEDGRAFVDAYLDANDNSLDDTFRENLYEHTGGHALFTVELLRSLQERGDLYKDKDGRLYAREDIDWDDLPARIEGVIDQRLGRLDSDQVEILSVASIEGETFTVAVVARIQELQERELVRRLSRELEGVHRLVKAEGLDWAGRQRLARYRFRHQLFQVHLYQSLDDISRAYLHEDVALALESLYGEQWEGVAAILAWHFEQAGLGEKALPYLLQAGDNARALNAFEDAVRHYRKALAVYKDLGDCESAARVWMKLGLTHHTAFQFKRSQQAFSEGFTLWQQSKEVQTIQQYTMAPHALRVGTFMPPVTLDPTRAVDNPSSSVIHQVFSGLVALTPELDIVPDLARSWEVLRNGQEYIFHLRDDAVWSDGVPVSAKDFEYAWKRVLDPKRPSSGAHLLFDIEGARAHHLGLEVDPDKVGVRAVNQATLVVKLEKPTSYFLNLLAYNITFPVPLHKVELLGEAWSEVNNLVCNGPFCVTSWDEQNRLALARNENYHGSYGGNVQEVEQTVTERLLERLQLYEDDQLDVLLLWGDGSAPLQQARERHASEYLAGPYLGTTYFTFDTKRPPFDDPRVRRALVLSTDRETLAHVILNGSEFPATGGFIPPGVPGHSPDIGHPYEPQQAQLLLAEAGYEGGDNLPLIQAVAPKGAETYCEYLRNQWQQILGIQTSWKFFEWSSIITILGQSNPHLFLTGWVADYPDGDSFLRVARNVGHWIDWQNEQYDACVARATGATDQTERKHLYERAERILVEQTPIMPLLYGRMHLLLKPWVRRLPISPIQNWFWKDAIIEQHLR